MKDDQQQTQVTDEKPRKKRFQLIKLEERIAPKMNGNSDNAGGTGNSKKCFGW